MLVMPMMVVSERWQPVLVSVEMVLISIPIPLAVPLVRMELRALYLSLPPMAFAYFSMISSAVWENAVPAKVSSSKKRKFFFISAEFFVRDKNRIFPVISRSRWSVYLAVGIEIVSVKCHL